MNSSLKYRGKSVYNGKWVYGERLNPECLAIYRRNKTHIDHIFCKVDRKTIDMSTGWLDSENQEIFQNDIVLIRRKNRGGVQIVKLYVIKYTKGLGWIPGIKQEDISGKRYEVKIVGNIHDNIRRENGEAVLWL